MRTALMIFKQYHQWTVYGSILYEAIRILHYSSLFFFCGAKSYGFIVGILAIIGFAERFADAGVAYTLSTFMFYFVKNKKCFISFLLYRTWLPLFPWLMVVSGATLFWLFTCYFPVINCTTSLFFYGIVVVSSLLVGTVTAQMRMLLYTVQQTKETILSELGAFILHVGFFWLALIFLPHLVGEQDVIAKFYLALYLAHGCGLCLLFSRQLIVFYRLLPEGTETRQLGLTRRMLIARSMQLFLRVGRSIFTAQFLTPFFAYYFGLYYAGVYYVTNKVIMSLLGVIKSVIYFSGNPLLGLVRNRGNFKARRIFYALSMRVARVFFWGAGLIYSAGIVAVFFLLAHDIHVMLMYEAFMLVSCLLIMGFFEMYTVLYEQYYVTHEKGLKFLMIKSAENFLFFSVLFFQPLLSSHTIFFTVILVQAAALMFIVFDGWRQWRLVPGL